MMGGFSWHSLSQPLIFARPVAFLVSDFVASFIFDVFCRHRVSLSISFKVFFWPVI
jgi:hypothetical protein